MIASELNDDAEYIASIVLGKKLLLYDANNKLKAYAYNFQVNDVKGYVVLGAHSKTFLIDGVYLDAQLSENMDRIYYFSNEEIYYQEQKKYYTSNYDTITEQEFQGYRDYKVGCYTNVSIELLESIQSQNQAIVYQSLHKFSELQVGNTHYKGTDSSIPTKTINRPKTIRLYQRRWYKPEKGCEAYHHK